jgi:YggT family protein
MVGFFIQFINIVSRLLTLIVIIDIVLSYFMSPYNSVRMALDRVVNPLLNPIRRVVPPLAMIDFSPLILIVLINIVSSVLINLLLSIG